MWWDEALERWYIKTYGADEAQAESFAEAFNEFLESEGWDIANLGSYHYMG